MIILFFSIIFFLMATVGLGQIFLKIFKLNYKNFSVGEIGLNGFVLLATLITFIHFFSPLTIFVNFIIYCIGSIFFFYNLLFKNFLILKEEKYFLFIILILSLLMAINHNPNEDFAYYHLPYITNFTSDKIIFGLSNLQLNQGWNSMWLNIKSSYVIPILNYNGVFISNIIFYILISLTFFNKIFTENKKTVPDYILIFCFFFLVFLNTKFSRLNTYGLDVPSNFLAIYSIFLFFKYYFDTIAKKDSFITFELLCLFLILATTFRVLNILLFIFPLFLLFKFKIPIKKIFFSKIIIFSSLFFIMWNIQQFIYTGCFIAPYNFTCIQAVPWIDPDIISNFQTDTSNVNKSFKSYTGDLTREEYLSSLNWVGTWFFRNKIELLEHVATFLLPILIFIFLSVFFEKKQNIEKFNSGTPIIAYITILFILIFWFVKAPVIRFGTHLIQLLVFFIFVDLFKNKIKFKNTNFLYLILILGLLTNTVKNSIRVDNDNILKDPFPKIQNIKYNTIIKNGFNLNIPEPNNVSKSELCWSVPIFCRISNFDGLEFKKVRSYTFILKK